jgi:hypothetical protein
MHRPGRCVRPPGAMRRARAFMLIVLCAYRAAAEEPAPDPSRGERYDGRAGVTALRDDVVLVPRLLLAPLRLTFVGLGAGLRPLVEWDERHHVHETILAAFSSRDGQLGVRPAFQYSLSYRPVVGLRFFDRRLLGRDTDFELTAMTGGTSVVHAELYARPTRSARALSLAAHLVYDRRDDLVFTAIGYADDDARRWGRPTRYAVDAVDALGELSWTASPSWFLGATGGFGVRRFGDGTSIAGDLPIAEVYCTRDVSGRCTGVDDVQVPDFNPGTQFARLSALARVDTRDNPYRPSSGAVLQAGADWTHGLGFDDSDYLRLRGSLVGVLDLWQRSRVLLVGVRAELLEPFGNYPVPFSELIVLGGPDDFRGFRPGRFRNFSSLLFAFEYRWPIWMWMDAELFTEYGGTFGRGFEGFQLGRMRPDVGAGVRLRSTSDFYLRAQVAYGWGDGFQLFLSFNAGL